MPESLRSFKRKVCRSKTALRRFMSRLQKNPPHRLDQYTPIIEKEVWKEVDCLTCANCCKTMTPTYTANDIKRISFVLGMTQHEFKKRWLTKDSSTGEWINQKTPCQFLNPDNKCSIYSVRPADCAGFPHLPKRRMIDYMHVHKQNIEYCPATLKMVEKMKLLLYTPCPPKGGT